jgi:hypothetical protein
VMLFRIVEILFGLFVGNSNGESIRTKLFHLHHGIAE